QVGFRDEDAPADDHAMWLQIATHGDVAYVDQVLASFTIAPGWSSENGYMPIDDGAYRWTLERATAFRSVSKRFLEQQRYPLRRHAELTVAMDRAFRLQLTLVIREQAVRHAHPLRSTVSTLRRVVAADWRVLAHPRFLRALAGRVREVYRIRSTQHS
ncbi:MAG: hypothetical protein ACREYC_19000, partial [Gammaproteobacteria bacterium]